MSFPRYPAYKDSGVEWLREIPNNWATAPLRHVIGSIESGKGCVVQHKVLVLL